MVKHRIINIILAVAALLSLGTLATVAYASHAWGNYHWARTANPFTVKLGNNVSSVWAPHLAVASADWSLSGVLDTSIVPTLSTPNCKAVKGRVEVCDNRYGNNGWLGLAQIWVSGDHIVQGTVKLNDTYFNTATYNKPSWRQFVACQEIGHTFGLTHQNETFNDPNLGSCMDYTNDPGRNDGLGDNLHPNTHDYDELALIYAHLDGFTTLAQSTGSGNGKPADVGQDIDPSDPSAWGQAVRQDAHGRNSLYVRDLGNNNKVFTFVVWAE